MVDRVRRPGEYEDFMKRLSQHSQSQNNDSKIFESYKDMLVFCAALGFKRSRRIEFKDKNSPDPVALHIFRGEYDMPFINALAIIETGNPKILSLERIDERIKIFEEYACGGLSILSSEIDDVDIEDKLILFLSRELNGSNLIRDITHF